MPLLIQSSKCTTPQLRHYSITNHKLIDKMPVIEEKYFSLSGNGFTGKPKDKGNGNPTTKECPSPCLFVPSENQASKLLSTKSDQYQALLNLT